MGNLNLGLQSRNATNSNTTLELDGTYQAGPYFWNGDLPELDKWYLVIGFIHESGYTGTTPTGGVYDGATGAKVLDASKDFKFATDATKILHRSYQFYTNNSADRQYFWEPAIHEVNGQEPSISEMMNLANGGGSVWNSSNNDINYTTGKVGIGTATPDEALTVKGIVHAQEVQVDLLGALVPDYVFHKDYDLKTLEQVRRHIDEHGHLPNIPSAEVIEKEGLNLKEMNLKLREKIEELTLYILNQDQNSRIQKSEIQELIKDVEKLKKLTRNKI